MAKEILAVPEEHLEEVIAIIRTGLHRLKTKVSLEVREQLLKWCDDEEEYLKRCSN